MQEVEAEFET